VWLASPAAEVFGHINVITSLNMDHPSTFQTTVHGTVFGERAARVEALTAGMRLLLIPDPPMHENPSIWVHTPEGDPLGYLPAEINSWLVDWLLTRGTATAEVIEVGGADVPSWRRLLIEVRCSDSESPASD
jgi:hypothetical protein